MQGPAKVTPAPIFNPRKRPRQAVIADPQTECCSRGPSGAAAFADLMPPGGFSNGRQQQQQRNAQPSSRGAANTNRSGPPNIDGNVRGNQFNRSSSGNTNNYNQSSVRNWTPSNTSGGNGGPSNISARNGGSNNISARNAGPNISSARNAGPNIYSSTSYEQSNTNVKKYGQQNSIGGNYVNTNSASRFQQQSFQAQGQRRGSFSSGNTNAALEGNISAGTGRGQQNSYRGQMHERGDNKPKFSQNSTHTFNNQFAGDGISADGDNTRSQGDYIAQTSFRGGSGGNGNDGNRAQAAFHGRPSVGNMPKQTQGNYTQNNNNNNNTNVNSQRGGGQTYSRSTTHTAPRNFQNTSRFGGNGTSKFGGDNTSRFGWDGTSRFGGDNTSKFGGDSTSKFGGDGTTMSVWDDSMDYGTGTTVEKSHQTNLKTAEKKPSAMSELEKSMHVFTMPVAGVRRWSKFKDTVQMMFELFGYLDSATARGSGGKEFLLRDDRKEGISCVFYEIDRQLPKMTRGHWYRVVGTYDQKNDKLKCISVRKMLDKEKSLAQTLVNQSSQTVSKLTQRFREQ